MKERLVEIPDNAKPKSYTELVENRVVELLTAGGSAQEVPAISRFTNALIWALSPSNLATFKAVDDHSLLSHYVTASEIASEESFRMIRTSYRCLAK